MRAVIRNERRIELTFEGLYYADIKRLMVKETADFLDEHRQSENPFFIYFAINMPHYPLQGEQKWRDYYKDLPSPRSKYAAFISSMDEKIGLVMHSSMSWG